MATTTKLKKIVSLNIKKWIILFQKLIPTMPLIIMTGFPSSGKSQAAKKIQQYFIENGKEADVLTEG